MTLHAEDLQLVYRYLDGEMSGDELERFLSRLEAEPDLRSALEQGQELRAWFEPGRQRMAVTASPVFAERVLSEVRRLPSREELVQAGAVDPAEELQLVGMSRKLLAAAVILAGLVALLASGLFLPRETDRLEASPDEIRTEMDRLDTLILSGEGYGRPEEVRER